MKHSPLWLRSSAAILLSAILLLSACGSDGSETGAVGTDENTSTENAAPTEESSDDEQAGDADVSATTDGVETRLVPEDTAVADTTAGVEAAQWSANVTITLADATWRFESNGIPNHELPDQFLVPQTGGFTPPVTESEVSAVDTSIAVVESPVDQSMTLKTTREVSR